MRDSALGAVPQVTEIHNGLNQFRQITAYVSNAECRFIENRLLKEVDYIARLDVSMKQHILYILNIN